MRLRAISVGYAVPRINFDAVVHSVFRSALNLRLAGEEGLLTLLAAGEGDLPQGILTDAPIKFSFEGLPVGTRGICRNGVLYLDNLLSIDLGEARRWEDNLRSLDVNMTNSDVVGAWNCAWQALNDRQECHGAEIVAEKLLYPTTKEQSALSRRVSESFGNILEATRRCELADDSGVGDLIGLGTGLTPSGDDLLTGFMAGLWCAAKRKPERLAFLSTFNAAVIRLSHRTNDISRTYLYHAAHGHVSSRLVNLARAICNGADPQHVRDCAEFAMQVGHTSGMDAVSGLLFGLMAWGGGVKIRAQQGMVLAFSSSSVITKSGSSGAG